MADKWIFKGQLIALDTQKAEITVLLDLGFGVQWSKDLRLHGVEAPMIGRQKAAATEWLKANEGGPVSVETEKTPAGYCVRVEALEGPMAGLSLNTQIELWGANVA